MTLPHARQKYQCTPRSNADQSHSQPLIMTMVCIFCFDGAREELPVTNNTRLRDIQQDLCRVFGQRFPAMKAKVRVGACTYDEFADKPFVNVAEKAECCNTRTCLTMQMHSYRDPSFKIVFTRPLLSLSSSRLTTPSSTTWPIAQ